MGMSSGTFDADDPMQLEPDCFKYMLLIIGRAVQYNGELEITCKWQQDSKYRI